MTCFQCQIVGESLGKDLEGSFKTFLTSLRIICLIILFKRIFVKDLANTFERSFAKII